MIVSFHALIIRLRQGISRVGDVKRRHQICQGIRAKELPRRRQNSQTRFRETGVEDAYQKPTST